MASPGRGGEVRADGACEYADRVTALMARDVGVPLLTFDFRRVVARASGRPSLVERGMATFLKCGGSVLAPHVRRSDSIVSNSNSTASFWRLFNTIGPNATWERPL